MQEVTLSSRDYGKARLTPSSKSDLDIQTRTLTSTNLWISSWIFGRNKIRISTVITFTINRNIFSVYMDGMLRKEALFVLTNLIQFMAEKLEKPISHIRGWGNGQITILIARLYSCIIRGACLPIRIQYWELYWDSGAVLGLAQYIAHQNNFMRTPAQNNRHLHDPPPPSSL